MALTLRLTDCKSRSRGSAVNVYICQGSLIPTVLGFSYFSWSMAAPCIHISCQPRRAEAILDPDGFWIAIWYFGSYTSSGWATYPTFSGLIGRFSSMYQPFSRHGMNTHDAAGHLLDSYQRSSRRRLYTVAPVGARLLAWRLWVLKHI